MRAQHRRFSDRRSPFSPTMGPVQALGFEGERSFPARSQIAWPFLISTSGTLASKSTSRPWREATERSTYKTVRARWCLKDLPVLS